MSEHKNLGVGEGGISKAPSTTTLKGAELLVKEETWIPSAVTPAPELDSECDEDDFPEGGTKAWMVVLGVRQSSYLPPF